MKWNGTSHPTDDHRLDQVRQWLYELPTPSLVVDAIVLRQNIQRAAATAREAGFSLRPHIKTHKSPTIALLQREAGATGITVATLDEAEAFARAGFSDIFIAYPMVGNDKILRFVQLSKSVTLSCAVDHPEHVRMLSAVAIGQQVNVRIEVDSGHHRCGVPPTLDILDLMWEIVKHKNLTLVGMFTHAGHAYGAANDEELEEIAYAEADELLAASKFLEKGGHSHGILSVGSTPTFRFAPKIKGIQEFRPGNYVFNDAIQVALNVAKPEDCALKVISTVVSVFPDHFVIDAGSKIFGLDKGAHGIDRVSGYGFFQPAQPKWQLARLSEEHGIVQISSGGLIPTIGERVAIVPNHACATVNLGGGFWLFHFDRPPAFEKLHGRR